MKKILLFIVALSSLGCSLGCAAKAHSYSVRSHTNSCLQTVTIDYRKCRNNDTICNDVVLGYGCLSVKQEKIK